MFRVFDAPCTFKPTVEHGPGLRKKGEEIRRSATADSTARPSSLVGVGLLDGYLMLVLQSSAK